MNCKHCKYFYKEEVRFWDKDTGDGVRYDGHCSNSLIIDDCKENNGVCPDNGIYSTCDEQRGELIIGENFGCIHFESK